MAEAGSVAWQFKRVAYFALPTAGLDSDKIFELAVEAGADDVAIGIEHADFGNEAFAEPFLSPCLAQEMLWRKHRGLVVVLSVEQRRLEGCRLVHPSVAPSRVLQAAITTKAAPKVVLRPHQRSHRARMRATGAAGG